MISPLNAIVCAECCLYQNISNLLTRSHTPGGENGAKIPRVKRKSEHNVPGSSEVYISSQNHWYSYSLKERNCFFFINHT